MSEPRTLPLDPGGRVIAGRYKLLRLVGHGGMGSVYEARHVHTDKSVAVKLLSAQMSADLKLVARFRREALAASRLEHENCVRVDDFGEDHDGTFYIAMEFINGKGLSDELRATGPFTAERTAKVGVQLLSALDAAHTAGVLHRDLKPQNVMVMQRPMRPDIVKVVDFGIAKITSTKEGPTDSTPALTIPGSIFGTPEYMSPEQARGDPLDHRSDIYSAAVVLWHMLLGRSPFRGSSVRETLLKVFSDIPPRPSHERPNDAIPPGLEDVLLRAMSKRAEDRYQSATAFLEALRPFTQGQVPAAPARPVAGLPKDGAPPPETLADGVHDTKALPAAELAPLATPLAQKAVAAPRVLTLDAVKPADAPAPAVVAPPSAPRKRISRTGVVVLLAAAGALVFLLGATLGVLALVRRGTFQGDTAVVDRAQVDPVTDAAAAASRARAVQAAGSVDAAARDAALARAEQAHADGNVTAARLAYEEALVADPIATKALVAVATIAMQQKDYTSACETLEKLMALDASYERQFAAMYALAKKRRDASGR